MTACPFCLVNIEDAIKVAGLEGKMEAIDLCELVDRHISDGCVKGPNLRCAAMTEPRLTVRQQPV